MTSNETIGDFKILEVVGQGGFSDVFKCTYRDSTNAKFAIKRLLPTANFSKVQMEIQILKELSEEKGISHLLGIIKDTKGINLIFPFYDTIDFQHFISTCSLEDVKYYMRSLLRCVYVVHKHEIIHRDIKPKNFLYDSKTKEGVLIDFGLSQNKDKWKNDFQAAQYWNQKYNEYKQKKGPKRTCNEETPRFTPNKNIENNLFLNNSNRKTLCFHCHTPNCSGRANQGGTPGFRAPEVLLKVVEQTPAIDLWSCGIVFLSLLTRRYPFILRHNGHTNDHDLMQICSLCSWEKLKEVSEQLRKEILTNPSSQPIDVFPFIQDAYKETEEEELHVAHDLLFRLLDVNMYTRISAEAALNHPFFQSIN